MIEYDSSNFGLSVLCKVRGSVFPRAAVWALPCSIVAMLLHVFLRPDENEINPVEGVIELWSGYTFVLGFLIVFRNNQAYFRFWEGATLVQTVRGEWFNATSSLIAFCAKSSDKHQQVEQFQQLLVRLVSMLHCSALQQVCELEDNSLEIIDTTGMRKESISHLTRSPDRVETILQWMQRLIVEASQAGAMDIPAPILSRAFQELSRGYVNLNNVRKIKDVPFPFPYAQMITAMLIVHWLVTPVLASQIVATMWLAGAISFFVTCAFWMLFYIAQEIDQPFGEDPNDLQVRRMQEDFNRSLIHLLDPLTQTVPAFSLGETISEALLRNSSYLNVKDFTFEDHCARYSQNGVQTLVPVPVKQPSHDAEDVEFDFDVNLEAAVLSAIQTSPRRHRIEASRGLSPEEQFSLESLQQMLCQGDEGPLAEDFWSLAKLAGLPPEGEDSSFGPRLAAGSSHAAATARHAAPALSSSSAASSTERIKKGRVRLITVTEDPQPHYMSLAEMADRLDGLNLGVSNTDLQPSLEKLRAAVHSRLCPSASSSGFARSLNPPASAPGFPGSSANIGCEEETLEGHETPPGLHRVFGNPAGDHR
mmetsp:Transcript_140212/g.355645  ORF Transcript_140212/g.355645 Transcript_140212/m.355645 type:complete len:591 (+) Transcript_140212:168-1940(+)